MHMRMHSVSCMSSIFSVGVVKLMFNILSLLWQGGTGPMQGQSNHFTRYAPEKIPYAVTRYQTETKRLYGTYDKHLAGRDWLVGHGKGKYSIAEMVTFPWVRISLFLFAQTPVP